MYARHDLSTDIVTNWLTGDSDIFYHLQYLLALWERDDSTVETIETDLQAYIVETLDNASPYSYAGKTRAQLSDSDLEQVNWTVVLGHLAED